MVTRFGPSVTDQSRSLSPSSHSETRPERGSLPTLSTGPLGGRRRTSREGRVGVSGTVLTDV